MYWRSSYKLYVPKIGVDHELHKMKKFVYMTDLHHICAEHVLES